MREWAGLGYYARARNLHACAKMVVTDFGGSFPQTLPDLLKLPGIGPYTAAAIGSIAFGLPAVPVDGNVERVITRLHAIPDPVKIAKPLIKALAQQMYDDGRGVDAGDLAQALMDLGATVCTPKSPKCEACPLKSGCLALASKNPENYPVAAQGRAKPTRYGYVYLIQNAKGQYLLERRPNKGLLAGMMGLPTTEWAEAPKSHALKTAPIKRAKSVGEVYHSFTHFDLRLKVVAGVSTTTDPETGFWYNKSAVQNSGLPRVFQKAFAFALKDKV
jgi:A/G-specific adenine glycosylase